MTSLAPEREVVDPQIDTSLLEGMDFEIACDILTLGASDPRYPRCQGDPAQWVAWRAGCCGQGPRFRLLCDHCKKVYQNWLAHHACITCPYCHKETGGYVQFTPLGKKS